MSVQGFFVEEGLCRYSVANLGFDVARSLVLIKSEALPIAYCLSTLGFDALHARHEEVHN